MIHWLSDSHENCESRIENSNFLLNLSFRVNNEFKRQIMLQHLLMEHDLQPVTSTYLFWGCLMTLVQIFCLFKQKDLYILQILDNTHTIDWNLILTYSKYGYMITHSVLIFNTSTYYLRNEYIWLICTKIVYDTCLWNKSNR